MDLYKIIDIEDCEDNNCPNVYKTDRDSYVIVGKKIADKLNLSLAEDELAVEISSSLLQSVKDKL